jgi:hypothetical protein
LFSFKVDDAELVIHENPLYSCAEESLSAKYISDTPGWELFLSTPFVQPYRHVSSTFNDIRTWLGRSSSPSHHYRASTLYTSWFLKELFGYNSAYTLYRISGEFHFFGDGFPYLSSIFGKLCKHS